MGTKRQTLSVLRGGLLLQAMESGVAGRACAPLTLSRCPGLAVSEASLPGTQLARV